MYPAYRIPSTDGCITVVDEHTTVGVQIEAGGHYLIAVITRKAALELSNAIQMILGIYTIEDTAPTCVAQDADPHHEDLMTIVRCACGVQIAWEQDHPTPGLLNNPTATAMEELRKALLRLNPFERYT